MPGQLGLLERSGFDFRRGLRGSKATFSGSNSSPPVSSPAPSGPTFWNRSPPPRRPRRERRRRAPGAREEASSASGCGVAGWEKSPPISATTASPSSLGCGASVGTNSPVGRSPLRRRRRRRRRRPRSSSPPASPSARAPSPSASPSASPGSNSSSTTSGSTASASSSTSGVSSTAISSSAADAP